MNILNAHSSNKTCSYQGSFQCILAENKLRIEFEVKTDNQTFFTDSVYSKESFQNWGMWEHDVFEIFIATQNNAPYLELQLSPLNQPFALIITEPHKSWNYPIDWDTFIHHSEVIDNFWKGTIDIELDKIPNYSDDKTLFINAFGIFGESREYYAWQPNPEPKPDHHRPDLFREIPC